MNNHKTKHMNMDSLIENMKQIDSQYKKVNKFLQIVFFIFIFLYAGLFLLNPDSELTLSHRIAGGCYVLAFSLFTLIFRENYKKYKNIDYSAAVKEMLMDAEKRYRFWQKDTLKTITGIILIDVATSLVVIPRFIDKWEFWNVFLIVQLVLTLAVGIGFTVGYRKWIKEFRSLWLSTKVLLKELEE